MDVVALRELTYRYPETTVAALDSVTLGLAGGITAVTGPSGGGKSTLLRVCNGLVPHFTGGTIGGGAHVLGHDVVTTPTRVLARDVGFVFQDPELQGVYATVERDVAFGLENACVPRRLMLQHVEEALQRTGIAHLRQRALATLSGGERQRVALAGALAQRPRLLVLDEPLSQLDSSGAAALMDTVAVLARLGTSVVVAEHRVRHVLPHCDRRLIIDGGRVWDGALDDVAAPAQAAPITPGSGAGAWALERVTAGVGGVAVLHDVSLQGAGDVVLLLGPNGGGKTTLLRTLAGLLPPLAGTVSRPAGRIAYLPQNPAAMLHRSSVRDELRWTLRHERHGDNDNEVESTLDLFDLAPVASRYPRDLSSGQRQRAAIAAVMAGTPALVLLDEPTRGMDAAARHALCRAIARACERGASVVVATHDESLVAALGGRTVNVADGVAREQAAAAAVVLS